MKKIVYNLLTVLILLSTFLNIGCSEDPTASIYDVIQPSETIPVDRYYDCDDKKIPKEVPYGITADPQGVVYVSLSGLGIKKITGDSLTVFAPKGPETFFRAITMASDSAIYAVRGGIKGIYKVVENTAPVAFVASSQGIADNVNDIEFDKTLGQFWAGGSTGILYSITFSKNVKKYLYLSGTINAVKSGNNNLYVAMRDTNNQEVVWKFPVVSVDSLGQGELFFNFTEKVDTVAKITDLAIAQDGDLFICTNQQSVALYVVHPDNTYGEFYDGLIDGSIYSFVWGLDQNAFFTNIKVNINTDVWKSDMKKLSAQ
jgi:hypothetical protein